jgi:PKD repeat protein
MNNPPVVDMGYVPNYVDEDQEISFDPTDSYDKESSSSDLEYFWDFGDGTTSEKSKIKHTYTSQRVYVITLTVTDGDGGSTEVNKSINIENVEPAAKASVNRSIANVYDSLEFTSEDTWDSVSDFDSLVYFWDFGDGTIKQGQDLNTTNHSYEKAGVYIIKLTVSDDDGANDTVEVKVRINSLPDMDGDGIPDIIDPDIDGDDVPNEVDEFPYDGSKSGKEEGEEDEDMTGTYIIAGIILIVICVVVILLIFMRPTRKKKEEREPQPDQPPDISKTEPFGEEPPVPSELIQPEDEFPLPPPPPPDLEPPLPAMDTPQVVPTLVSLPEEELEE